MADELRDALIRSLSRAGVATAEALPPSELESATVMSLEQALGDLERAMFTQLQWEDAGVQEGLRGLRESAARGITDVSGRGRALCMSVLALTKAVDVYGADPSAINLDLFARAVVLARAYAASPAAMTVESDESPTPSAAGHPDPADFGPAVKALVEIVQDIEPDDGEPPIALLTECLAAAAQAAITNTPWAVMRVYGSRVATALATVEGRGDDVAESMSLAAGRVAAQSWTQGTSARDAFAQSIAAVIDAIGLVTSAQESQQDALSSLLVRALGLAAVATAAVRVDERLKE